MTTNPHNPAKRAAIYARVSTDKQEEKGYSLETQLDASRKYASEHNYTVLPDHEFIEAFTSMVTARPNLDKALEAAESGAFDVLVLYCMDRLTRGGPGDLAFLKDEFKRYGVRIEYVTEQFGIGPEGDLSEALHSAIAQYEHAKLLERTKRGRRGRAKAGKFIPGGENHYGYKYVRKAIDGEGHVEIDEHEAEIVRFIFNLYTIDRLGSRQIAARLTEMKIPTRWDTCPTRHKTTHLPAVWGHTSVDRMLAYEGYAGVHYFNQATYIKANGKQKRVENPRSEWIAITIPPIIDRATFDLAETIRHSNMKAKRRSTPFEYLMRSRIKCDVCKFTFQADTDSRPKLPNRYYSCGGQKSYRSPDKKTVICHRNLRADKVDPVVWDYVVSVLKHPELVMLAFNERQKEQGKAVAKLERELQFKRERIAANDLKQKELLDLYLDKSAISKEALNEKAAQLNTENADLTQDIKRLEAQITREVISQQRIENAEQWCARVREGLDYFTYEDKLDVINLLDVTAIIQRGDTPDQDVIIVSGFLPTAELDIQTGALLSNVPCSGDSPVSQPYMSVAVFAPRSVRISS